MMKYLRLLQSERWLEKLLYIQHKLHKLLIMQLTQRKTTILNSFFTEKLLSTGYDGVLRYYRKVRGISVDYVLST